MVLLLYAIVSCLAAHICPDFGTAIPFTTLNILQCNLLIPIAHVFLFISVVGMLVV